MEKNDRLLQLITDKLAGEAGPEELKELDALLQEDRDMASTLALLEVIWGTGRRWTKKKISRILPGI